MVNLSSNIHEVIRAVLNVFFLQKYFASTKSTKSTKRTKTNKRHKDTQVKVQNANKRVSDYFPLDVF